MLQEDLELSMVPERGSLLEGSQVHKDEGNRCRPIVLTLGRWGGWRIRRSRSPLTT